MPPPRRKRSRTPNQAARRRAGLPRAGARHEGKGKGARGPRGGARKGECAKVGPESSGSGAAAAPRRRSRRQFAAGPKNYTVPAGTSISVQLPAAISSKTAKVGDRLSANLTNDVVVDGKTVAKAGALVQGSVTQVVSGSNTIGGTPTLGITFDNLVRGRRQADRRAHHAGLGKERQGGRHREIAGGAVAGGVIGHQISHKNGSVIGAIIGAAAGTAAAKKTGKEVVLPAGTVGMSLESPVTVTM